MDDSMDIITIVIAAVVLLCYGVAFLLSFYKSYAIQKQVINGESIDKELTEKLVKDSENYFKLVEESTVEEDQRNGKEVKNRVPYSFEEYRNRKARGKKGFTIFMDIIYILIFIVLLAIDAVGIIYRFRNEPIFFGDNAYIVVATGSMSELNTDNLNKFPSSIQGNDYRIPTKSLIRIKKIDTTTELHKNDVLAYYSEDRKEIIVHRVVQVDPDENGMYYCSFRGDANNTQSTWESSGRGSKINVGGGKGLPVMFPSIDVNGNPLDKKVAGKQLIVGRYFEYIDGDPEASKKTMWKSEPLGFIISYVQSELGILCISSAFVVLLLYFIFENASSSREEKREKEVIKLIDEGKDVRYKWYNVEYRANKKYELLTEDIYIDRL